MELSKSNKKVARQLIEKGLQQEFANGLRAADEILTKWKSGAMENKASYHTLYQHIKDFDKHIARRYDSMTGSRYIFIVAAQLADGILSPSDLEVFPEDVRQIVLHLANLAED